MKTKRIFFSTSLVIIVAMLVLYACKKQEPSTAINPATTTNETNTQPNILARGTGTETMYSVDTNGVHYKMELVWNTSGGVTIDRTIITSGYPSSDTIQTTAIEYGISVTKIDHDTDTTSFDTLVVNFDPELHYYLIAFDPDAGGTGHPSYSIDPYGYRLKCTGCSSCSVRASGPQSYYCAGCSKICGIMNRPSITDDVNEFRYVPKGGTYLIEATSITIIH